MWISILLKTENFNKFRSGSPFCFFFLLSDVVCVPCTVETTTVVRANSKTTGDVATSNCYAAAPIYRIVVTTGNPNFSLPPVFHVLIDYYLSTIAYYYSSTEIPNSYRVGQNKNENLDIFIL